MWHEGAVTRNSRLEFSEGRIKACSGCQAPLAHHDLIARLVRRDVEQRFRGSRLGWAWLLLQPLVTIATFYFVFVVVFNNRWGNADEPTGEFILALFVGILVFNVFSEIVGKSPGLISGNVNFVKKVVFPLDILPVVSALSALVLFVLGACIWLITFMLVRGGLPPMMALVAPLFLVPIVLYAVGTTWVLSAISVYFRDIGQAVPLVLQALIFLTPVLYPLDRVPGALRGVLMANPLTIPLEAMRNACLSGSLPDLAPLSFNLAGGLAVAAIGHAFFQRARLGFADVL